MARVIICDDDQASAEELAAALRAVKHDATTSVHMMDVLREAAEGRFDLVARGRERRRPWVPDLEVNPRPRSSERDRAPLHPDAAAPRGLARPGGVRRRGR